MLTCFPNLFRDFPNVQWWARWWIMTFVGVTDFQRFKLEWCAFGMSENVIAPMGYFILVFFLVRWRMIMKLTLEYSICWILYKVLKRLGQWSMTFLRTRNCEAGELEWCILGMCDVINVGVKVMFASNTITFIWRDDSGLNRYSNFIVYCFTTFTSNGSWNVGVWECVHNELHAWNGMMLYEMYQNFVGGMACVISVFALHVGGWISSIF